MKTRFKIGVVLVIALSLMWAGGANAQALPGNFVFNSNVPTAFGQSGIIQGATVFNAADANSGGTLTMNGITMIVPANSVVQMPANTLKWAALFDPTVFGPVYDAAFGAAPTPITIPAGTSGLALLDNPAQTVGISPYMPFNAIVLGNIDVKGTTTNPGTGLPNPPGTYIVGLILPIDQDLGNAGEGFITFIDYAKGRFEVNGTLNTAGTGTIIEINDPLGRFGLAHSPDPRWSVDPDNPTVTSGNGYPMGISKVAFGAGNDPDRPFTNRPVNPAIGAAGHDPFLQAGVPFQAFTMPPSAAAGSTVPDPWKQAPYLIGDYVGWAGILCKIDPTLPLNPALPINQQLYVSANTVESDKLGIYTASGTVAQGRGPCYLAGPIRHSVVGTGGAPITVPGNPALGIVGGTIPLPEPKNVFAAAGWCTDSTNLVDILAVDINPVSGVETTRLLGSVLPQAGQAGKGQKGRFTFNVGKANFGPPTRVYKFRSRHGELQLPNQVGLNGAILPGLLSGQFHYPQFGFQFPDSFPGFPVMPNNFNAINFLTQGEGGNPSAGALNPFPPFTP